MKVMLEDRYVEQECRTTLLSLCEGSGDDYPGGGALHHDCVGRGNHAAHEVLGAADGTLQVQSNQCWGSRSACFWASRIRMH